MFDVLVYLYENYWRPDACPDARQLSRKLSAVGFENEEIEDALTWLAGLATVSDSHQMAQSPDAVRVYCPAEHDHLGSASIGFVSFLESAGVLRPPMREMVIDRAMAIAASVGEEPDALILDELFVDDEDRLIH
jgi:Smg protein